ncbi:MAG: HAD-IIA family hydrolase [Acidilobaceae archaeon]
MTLLDNIEYIIVDLDGVVWRGRDIIEDNVSSLARLLDLGFKLRFITNNSTKSRADYIVKLRSLGLKVNPEDVTTSGRAASLWLKRVQGESRVYVIGEEGLVEELRVEGHIVTESSLEASSLVVGLDRRVCYNKLSEAVRALARGILFIATNLDPNLPQEDTIIPGAGAIIAFLEVASGRKPDFIAGKPNPWILEVALGEAIDYSRVLVIGDRIDTDIVLAEKVGAKPVLVLTGAHRTLDENIRKQLEHRGVIVLNNLKELINKT